MSKVEKCSVAAIVVTYNRKELLRQCLYALLSQTSPLDQAFVVDNASSDGTDSMVLSEFPEVTYVRIKENVGASGAIYEGMKLAYDRGHKWFWIMDDDARSERDALAALIESANADSQKKCVYACHIDEQGWFSEPIYDLAGKTRILRYDEAISCGRLIRAFGGPFLGVLIPRCAIDDVGLPAPWTFIWGDYEYFYRLRHRNYQIFYDTRAKIYHPRHRFYVLKLGTMSLWFPAGPAWKQYYGIRNSLYFALRQTEFRSSFLWRFARACKVIGISIVQFMVNVWYGPERLRMAKFCFLGLVDGISGKMGRRIYPG